MNVDKIIRKLRKFITLKPTSTDFYRKYSALSREQNVLKKYLILSFDCDIPDDAAASEEIAGRFKQRNITAVFAVPGKRLEEAETIYRFIAESGFEFMNHGYLDHGVYDESTKKYVGTTWYHEMDEEDVRQDIRSAHDCILNIIGVSPQGYRAPHFGYFRNPRQLEMIYSEIAKLGYAFASTTMPEQGLQKGAVYPVTHNLLEFPLTGTFDNPHILLDSWQFLAAPDRIFSGDDYVLQFKQMVDFFSDHDLPCIMNFYSDPSHVIDFKGFFDCVEYALDKKIEITSYSRILSELKGC